jgi:hypothetical protein
MRSVAFVLLLAAVAFAGPAPDASVRPIDLDRLRELYRLTDRFGEHLWPGFDARKVPIGLNHEDRLELLIAHPRPPEMFHALPDQDLQGVPILVREGSDRFGPGNGGVAADLYGVYSVTMNTLQPGNTTDNYLSVFLHECFHVYQRMYRADANRRKSTLPEHDAAYSALTGLECRVLDAAVRAADEEEARALARMFLAVRRERRAGLAEGVVRAEGDGEYDEGTATYVQVRLFDLILAADGFEAGIDDPHYSGFENAAEERERMLDKIVPHASRPIRFHLAKYQTGLAQCLLLDRLRPGWKEELRAAGSTLTGILGDQLPLEPEDAASLAAAAKVRFDHAALLAQQTALVDKRLARIRAYVTGPGTRYRIHTGSLAGTPRSKPRGPAYLVPAELRGQAGRLTVWAQGIWYQRGGLTLDTRRVPVLLYPGYLEWIDRDPAADGSDLVIECDRQEGGVYEGLRVTTDGFVLTVDRARIQRSGDAVAIRPVPRPRR